MGYLHIGGNNQNGSGDWNEKQDHDLKTQHSSKCLQLAGWLVMTVMVKVERQNQMT